MTRKNAAYVEEGPSISQSRNRESPIFGEMVVFFKVKVGKEKSIEANKPGVVKKLHIGLVGYAPRPSPTSNGSPQLMWRAIFYLRQQDLFL